MDAEREEALRAIVDRAEHLDGVIDTLLAVARQELDPAAGTVDLREIAGEYPDVRVDAQHALPRAEGGPEVVRRIVAALLDNARRHGAGEGWIELRSRDELVILDVRDDGPGLDPALGERAFEPGVRSGGEPSGGAGLGLPLARRLARSCGGEVRVGDGPGGSFVVELPAVGAAADPRSSPRA